MSARRGILSWLHPGDRILTACVDGEAPRWLAHVVRRHIESCSKCREQAGWQEQILRAGALACDDIDEQMISEMVASGREKLLLSMGETKVATPKPEPGQTPEAELIFGSHNLEDDRSLSDATLASRYDAILGNRTRDTNGGR